MTQQAKSSVVQHHEESPFHSFGKTCRLRSPGLYGFNSTFAFARWGRLIKGLRPPSDHVDGRQGGALM
jgi:hypothetical protein